MTAADRSSGELLWTPSSERVERALVTRFARERGLPEDYHDLWRWSVENLEQFWRAIWEHYRVEGDCGPVFGRRAMPGTEWFPQAEVSYPAHMFRDKADDQVALVCASELHQPTTWTWGDLRTRTARIAAGLERLGVTRGDRVAAVMPNAADTVAAFLATASLGAVWSSAAPEFGARTVTDRFAQIEPKVLLATDGYRYGGRDFECTTKTSQIHDGLDGAALVRFGHLDGSGWPPGFLGPPDAALRFERVPFNHPLWVLYSSGTTGLPKAIVHSQGGVLLEQLKCMHLQIDAQAGDRIFWFTTTGWMVWNWLVSVLLTDAAIVLYDGDPTGDTLWDLAEATGVTTFGTSAAFIHAAMKAGVEPRSSERQLASLRAVGSTGSPLSSEGFSWIYDRLGPDLWVFAPSGGTDVVTAFVGGVPTLPVHRGEIQAPALGVKVEAWDEHGRSLIGQVGELVVTEPMPSMPVALWNDPGGVRLSETYFEHFPGVWRHGDWIEITERGTSIIHGRSDSTINRGGIRMGTSELYRAVLAQEEVLDALVVDVPVEGAENWMPLFVVLREGTELTQELCDVIRRRIREDCSPRHVPDAIHQIAGVPRTLSGKALEVPVKRILSGIPADQAVSRDSLANPDALDWFTSFAGARPRA